MKHLSAYCNNNSNDRPTGKGTYGSALLEKEPMVPPYWKRNLWFRPFFLILKNTKYLFVRIKERRNIYDTKLNYLINDINIIKTKS